MIAVLHLRETLPVGWIVGKRIDPKQQGLTIEQDRTGVVVRKEGRPTIRIPNANIVCTEDA
jgi:hypothetical protein